MKIMFERSVRPELERDAGGAVILSKTLHTFGLENPPSPRSSAI
jgi:hypothetical protein